MDVMKKSLARAIFREARSLRNQGPGAGFQLPAIYDICNSVNPNSAGITLENQRDYQNFAKSYFDQWCIAQEFSSYRELRKIMPSVLYGEGYSKVDAFYAKPGFIRLNKPRIHCPFEVLRAFKYQNSITKASSRAECNGVTINTVTGYARELSSPKENVFSYNIMFHNTSSDPVRILDHTIKFKSGATNLGTEHRQGINNTMPVIMPGECYVCGSTAAFPKGLENVTVEGSFHMLEKGFLKDAEFEKLNLSKKWNILKAQGATFSAKLPETLFTFDVPCDTQPLSEKFEVPTVEEAEVGK